jgi:cysteine desulfurase
MTYLDHNATSPLRPEARAAMERALSIGGNPSSVHRAGRAARAIVEDAREKTAKIAGSKTSEVVFTSGGTEANALVLRGAIAGAAAQEHRIARLLVVSTAHDSVRATAELLAETTPGLRLSIIPVTGDGLIDSSALRMLLINGKGRALVSLLFVNNETGAIENIEALAKLIRAEAQDSLIHVDCVAAGYSPLRFADWNIDYLILSAHKIGGPQGAGALIACEDAPLVPLVPGHQENRRRGGTENLGGIAGFAAALNALDAQRAGEQARIATLRDDFENRLRAIVPNVVIFSERAPRAANTSCFAIPGLPAETALIALDLDGVCVSSGAACSSGKVGASHVLAAMGVPENLARCALRLSLGWSSTKQDIEAALNSLERLLARRSALAAA